MFKSISALVLIAFNQFNWLIHDQHFTSKKEKKYSFHDKKIKDAKDAKKSTSKPVQKQTISRFKIFKQPEFLKVITVLGTAQPLKIPTIFKPSTNFITQTRFNYSSIKAVWFGCCRHRI